MKIIRKLCSEVIMLLIGNPPKLLNSKAPRRYRLEVVREEEEPYDG